MLVTGLIALAALTAATGAVCAARRMVAVVAVDGPSMEPALAAGDKVLVRRAKVSGIRPGQIVVFERPSPDGAWAARPPRWLADRREWMIKRVAAVPGDPVPDGLSAVGIAGQRVPDGKLVVLGDNSARSHDSRALGYIPAERLLGVMVRPVAH